MLACLEVRRHAMCVKCLGLGREEAGSHTVEESGKWYGGRRVEGTQCTAAKQGVTKIEKEGHSMEGKYVCMVVYMQCSIWVGQKNRESSEWCACLEFLCMHTVTGERDERMMLLCLLPALVVCAGGARLPGDTIRRKEKRGWAQGCWQAGMHAACMNACQEENKPHPSV